MMNEMLKICLVIPYFERPKMFLNAIESIKKIRYNNWEIRIVDDGSVKSPVREILENNLSPELLKKIIVYNTNDTVENKITRGGSIHGRYMNIAFKESDADIFIMMSDDDAIYEDYFNNLNSFYLNNPDVNYSYSHVIPFDPYTERPDKNLKNLNTTRHWNTSATTNLNHTIPLNPYCKVDSTQVSWRSKCNKEYGVWLPDTQTKNLDASFYEKMYKNFGNCVYNGFISVYKGFHRDQLSNKAGINQYQPFDM